MVSTRTNEIEKRAPLLRTNFSQLETLFLGPKPYLYSKCPFLSQRQIAFLGPLKYRYCFGPRNKVSSWEKPVLRSGARFPILFVLADATPLGMDLRKRTMYKK